MWLHILVFLANMGITLFSTRHQMAVNDRKLGGALFWGGLLDFAISLDAMGMVVQKWEMVPWILAGGAVGTCIAMRDQLMALVSNLHTAILRQNPLLGHNYGFTEHGRPEKADPEL
jgi:hypothetical protein